MRLHNATKDRLEGMPRLVRARAQRDALLWARLLRTKDAKSKKAGRQKQRACR